MRWITIIDFLCKLLLLILIFAFIKIESDYLLYPLLVSMCTILGGIIAQIIIFKKFRLVFFWIGIRRCLRTVRSQSGIFMNQFLPQLYNNSTTVVLSFLSSAAAVGTFGALKAVIEIGNTTVHTVSTAFFPLLVKSQQHFNKFRTLLFWSSIALALGVMLAAPVIIRTLQLEDEKQSYLILAVLSVGICFNTLYLIYGTNYFLARGNNKVVLNNTLVSSIIGFLCAIPLIYFCSGIGAAINLTLSRGLMGLGLRQKYLKINENSNSQHTRILQ